MHPRKEENFQGLSFHKYFYKKDEELGFKISEKTEKKQGKAVAVFITQDLLILIKVLQNKFFISKFEIKESIDASLTCKNYMLKHYFVMDFKNLVSDLKKDLFLLNSLSYSNKNFALYRNKFLVSGLHPSNSLMIHDFKGQLVQTIPFHTNLITAVSTSFDFIFSGSIDSSVISYKPDEKLIVKPFLKFFGHRSPIIEIKALESYQIIVSGDYFGIILIHDIRTAECLAKINENFDHLALSELGFIAIGRVLTVKIFDLNGEEVCKKIKENNDVNTIKFTMNGDFFLALYENTLEVNDVTNPSLVISFNIPGVCDFVIHPNEKCVYACCNTDNDEFFVVMVKFLSKNQKTEQISNFI